jgi:hypothetical protein
VTSERKISANRANARASTGPKTERGRLHGARNALRHALSLPVSSDPVFSEEVEVLTREIIGTDADPELKVLAHRIAEAQIDLRRVRHARHQLLSRVLSADPYHGSAVTPGQASASAWPDIIMEEVIEEVSSSKPEAPYQLTAILVETTPRLLALDRYERRALSRRKFAIRAFDAARSVRV